MSTEVIAKPQAFQAMTADLSVSMDDVVSAFVSQYENNLFARKKELNADIRKLEAQLEDLEKRVRADVSGSEWEGHKLPFDLTLKVIQGNVNYEGKVVHFQVLIESNETRGYYGNQIKLEKTKKIPARFIKEHDGIVKGLNDLRADLSEVLVNIKTITRKERQVRGRIALRKLEDSGYASLMADPELIQLVQLEEE